MINQLTHHSTVPHQQYYILKTTKFKNISLQKQLKNAQFLLRLYQQYYLLKTTKFNNISLQKQLKDAQFLLRIILRHISDLFKNLKHTHQPE